MLTESVARRAIEIIEREGRLPVHCLSPEILIGYVKAIELAEREERELQMARLQTLEEKREILELTDRFSHETIGVVNW